MVNPSDIKTPPLILVVDDDEDFRDSLAGFLETREYRVHVIGNGTDALAYCKELIPDLILLDADMPGMDGFHVCSQLYKTPETALIPVIMITAMADSKSVDSAFAAGAQEYITKPVNWSVLHLRIRRIIEQRRLEAQQLIYTSAFEQSPVSIVIADLKGTIQYVNPAFLKVTGYGEGEVIGQNPRLLQSGKTPPEIYKDLWSYLVEGKEWRGEFYNRKKNGDHFLESATIVPIRNRFGVISHYLASKEDITEKRRGEKALQESWEQYRQLLETSKFVPWEVDLDSSRFIYMGPQIVDLLGYPAQAWYDIGYWASRIHPDDREQSVDYYVSATTKGEDHDFEYRMIASDGKIVWFRDVVTVVRRDGQVIGLRGFFIDITQQKEAEDELHQAMDLLAKNENQLQAILANTSAVVFLKDLQGRYLMVNRRFEELFHISNQEIVGKTDFDVFPPQIAKILQDNDRKSVESGKSLEIEELIQHDDGQHTYISVKFPLYDESRKIFAVGGIATDITERKHYEENLREAKQSAELANKAKSQFLAAMSHDIRTPMNAILGMGEVLAESELSQAQRQYLEVLTHAGEGLLALINDILDLSKIEAGQLQMESVSFDLYELVAGIDNILHHRAKSGRIALAHQLHPSCPHLVIGDPQRLRQVLLNLLGNAIKFTQQGEVTLRVEAQDADLVLFVVSDTGIGIEQEKLLTIFQPFTQADSSTSRRFGGSGLGLAICNHLVEEMGGKIWAESVMGIGSQFSFTARLPKSTGSISDEVLTQVVRQQGRDGKSIQMEIQKPSLDILLVDDSEDNRLVLSAFLQKSSHTFQVVTNGKEALERVKSSQIDLILMDMMMPVMDGFEATKQIRMLEKFQGRKRVPIVAITANAMKVDMDRTIAAGCDLHLSKPIRMAHLLEVIDHFAITSGKTGKIPTELHNVPVESTGDATETKIESINWEAFEQLREDIGDDIYVTFRTYLKKLQKRILDIAQAVEQNDNKDLSSAAHSLKGSSAILGLERFANICHQMEMDSRSGCSEETVNLLHDLQAEGENVQLAIEAALKTEKA